MAVIRYLLCSAILAIGCGPSLARQVGDSPGLFNADRVGVSEPNRLYLYFVLRMISWQQSSIRNPEGYEHGASYFGADQIARIDLWTWVAKNGSFVYRQDNGTFRLVKGYCLKSFCRHFDCRQLKWPTFTCTDEQKRKMSAPDMATMDFGGTVYRRLK